MLQVACMKRWLYLALVAPALALAACDRPPITVAGDGGAPPDAGPTGVLQLGEGEGEFRAIEDGDTLLIARGCQGSQHVWLTLRSSEMDPRGVIVDLDLTRARDGERVSAPLHVRLSFEPIDGQAAQLTGLTLQIPDALRALREDLVLEGRAEDRDGRVAVDTRRVRVAWGSETCMSL